MPPLPGLREAEPWTSREATTAKAAPRRLVVLGGGVVGMEMAQAWKALGSEEVTVLEQGPSLLPRLEPFAGEHVAAFREDGIALRLSSSVLRVERPQPGGAVTVHLDDGTTVDGDELLVAAGRAPAPRTSVSRSSASSQVGSCPSTTRCASPGRTQLYAAGDVNGRVLLTHQGKYQARVVSDAVLARSKGEDPPYLAEADVYAMPQVVFTDPEVAAVGLSTAEAAATGLRTRTVEYEIGHVAGASLQAEGYKGRAALVVDEDAGVVVGTCFVGQDVAELVHAATVAVVGGVPLERLRHAVPSYPTTSEVWLRLLEEYGQ